MPHNHKGGGSWDEYCYCCGYPFYFEGSVPGDTITEDPKKAAALEKEISKRANAIKGQIKWLVNSIGLDSKHDLIFALASGSDAGMVDMEQKQPSAEAQKMYSKGGHVFITGDRAKTLSESNDSPCGLAIHKDCAAVLEKEIGRKLVPSDETILWKIKKPNPKKPANFCNKKYTGQMFEWGKALLDNKFSFASPLADKKHGASFLKCNASLIKAFKGTKGGVPKTEKQKKGANATRKVDKKYLTRDSPPYPANEHCGETKEGNDGRMYISTPDKNKICKWKLKG